MHSRDPSKSQEMFNREIQVIMAGSSDYQHRTDQFDFTRFVFPKADFRGETFTKRAYFSGATFTEAAVFSGATFTEAAVFGETTFLETANFHGVRFLKPDLVQFISTNQRQKEGLRARFVNCQVEGVRFEAVNWHRRKGRMVLQDEVDITERPVGAASHEEVAIAYRRLISNFEKARAYDLVEDCTIGEFEMKRKDPDRFIFANQLGSHYKRLAWLRRWVGEPVSVVGIYRLVSLYGTSYRRALVVLGLLLLAFGVLFSVIGIAPVETGVEARCGVENAFKCLSDGLFHAVEVATLQRDSVYKPVSRSGFMVEILEQVFVAGQAALFLFALRRRFRR